MDYSPGGGGWPVTALGTGPLSDSLCLLPHPHCPEVESRQRRTAGRRVLSARQPVGAPHYPPQSWFREDPRGCLGRAG